MCPLLFFSLIAVIYLMVRIRSNNLTKEGLGQELLGAGDVDHAIEMPDYEMQSNAGQGIPAQDKFVI